MQVCETEIKVYLVYYFSVILVISLPESYISLLSIIVLVGRRDCLPAAEISGWGPGS